MIGWLAGAVGQTLRWLTALCLLLGVVVGVPVGLWTQVGWPLPHTIPTSQALLAGLARPVTETLIVNTLAIVLWVAWGQFTVGLLVESVAVVRHLPAPRLCVAGPLQPLAARLVGAVLVTILVLTHRASGGLPPPSPAVTSDLAHMHPAAALPPQPDGTEPDRSQLEKRPRHVVLPHETLWGIAETRLDDGRRWKEIYQLNKGRLQEDGRRLADPGLIRPGWILTLPADATPLPEPEPEPVPPDPPSPPPAQDPPAPPTTDPTPLDTTPAPTPQPPERDTREAPIAIELPSGSVIGVSLALAVLVAWEITRRRRRRHRQPAAPSPGIRHEPDPRTSPFDVDSSSSSSPPARQTTTMPTRDRHGSSTSTPTRLARPVPTIQLAASPTATACAPTRLQGVWPTSLPSSSATSP